MSLWVKICGITTVVDAEAAVDAGVDAIGLNFWPASPRCVTPDVAHIIAAAVRAAVQIVAVTVDMPLSELQGLRRTLQPDWVQLHGHTSNAELVALQPGAYRAVGLAEPQDVDTALKAAGDWVLVDARDAVRLGGTGTAPPWELAAQVCRCRRTILAGGLGPDNVAAAVQGLQPAGVDAASRLETAPGRKDVGRMRAFVQAARAHKTRET